MTLDKAGRICIEMLSNILESDYVFFLSLNYAVKKLHLRRLPTSITWIYRCPINFHYQTTTNESFQNIDAREPNCDWL